MTMALTDQPDGEARLTGRAVLLAFIAFFGTVAVVNGVMIGAALSTFSGADTRNPYQVGLAFNREYAAARDQNELNWTVSAHLTRPAAGRVTLAVTVKDHDGRLPEGIHVTAALLHPADGRRDHVLELVSERGSFIAPAADIGAGQWDLIIEAHRDDARLFRSRTRVQLD
jgi:nitrogen fixation protein FixH